MMSLHNCRCYVSPISNANIQQGRGHLSLTLVRLETIFEIWLIFDVPVCIAFKIFSANTSYNKRLSLRAAPFSPDPAAEKPNSHSLPHERGKGCLGSLQPCESKQE